MSDQEKLAEISRLLNEAHLHYAKHNGGLEKSSDGHISADYGTHWDRVDSPDQPAVTGVTIYAYSLGPTRRHYFDNLDQALKVVQQWHRWEMARDYADPYDVDRDLPDEPCLYTAIEAEREVERALLHAGMDEWFREHGCENYAQAAQETEETKNE